MLFAWKYFLNFFVGGAITSSNAGERLRTSESVAASFIRDRVTQQGESKLSEGADSTFGKKTIQKKDLNLDKFRWGLKILLLSVQK
jgi:hypothetical protein